MAQGYHDSDVIFTEESLIAFIKSIHENIGDNYHFVSTADMMKRKKANSNIHFMREELEINTYFPNWEVDYPANICVINYEIDYNPLDLNNGRYIWLSVNDLLQFEDNFTPDYNPPEGEGYAVSDYNQSRKAGTFVLNQNNSQNVYCVKIKGFDDKGNFDHGTSWKSGDDNTGDVAARITTDILYADVLGSKNVPISDAYITNLNLTNYDGAGFQNGQLIIKNDAQAGRPNDNTPNAGTELGIDSLTGSIRTAGGIAAGRKIMGSQIYAAVFNDYAECRKTISLSPGHVVIDNDDGSLSCSDARLQPGAQVISDTYGNLMGETNDCQTPIAVAGRVLVYPYQNRENYHAGMAVCSAPDGTVDIMTREEIRDYPDCIVGIVSEIPQYEKWGSNQVDVNGRIWIKVK